MDAAEADPVEEPPELLGLVEPLEPFDP